MSSDVPQCVYLLFFSTDQLERIPSIKFLRIAAVSEYQGANTSDFVYVCGYVSLVSLAKMSQDEGFFFSNVICFFLCKSLST